MCSHAIILEGSDCCFLKMLLAQPPEPNILMCHSSFGPLFFRTLTLSRKVLLHSAISKVWGAWKLIFVSTQEAIVNQCSQSNNLIARFWLPVSSLDMNICSRHLIFDVHGLTRVRLFGSLLLPGGNIGQSNWWTCGWSGKSKKRQVGDRRYASLFDSARGRYEEGVATDER